MGIWNFLDLYTMLVYNYIMERDKDFVYLDRFVWDTDKNEINKKKHGISFETASRVFSDPFMLEKYDDENSTLDEIRYNCIGMCDGNLQVLAVSMTERGDMIRIFTARHAEKREVREYEENAANL